MRHVLLGSVGTAALLVSAGRASAAPPALNWSGFYAGFGLARVQTQTNEVYVGTPPDENNTSTLAGAGLIGDVGYNWASGNLVYGLEGDVGVAQSGTDNIEATITVSPFATLRGRLGVVVGNALIYGTGGVAIADTTINDDINAPGFDSQGWRPGLVAGAGAEFALTDKMTLRVEGRVTAYQLVDAEDIPNSHYTTQTNTAIGLVGLQFHM